MFGRLTTFRRETVSGDRPSSGPPHAGAGDLVDGMTRAQVRAQSRCAPLTPAEFKARRHVADQGIVPLSELLDEGANARKG